MRINKYIASAGLTSRRGADRLVEEGRVTIDGMVAMPGDDVAEHATVCVNGQPISVKGGEKTILLYNKPVGLICSASDKDGKTVLDMIDYPARLFYVGRLDKMSRGLMLLTDDGDLADRLMRGRNAHEREYIVTCTKRIPPETIKAMSAGVYLKELEVKTRPCKITRISDEQVSVVLTQGLNRQIRRMFAAFDLRVADLVRVRIENLSLGKLMEGTYRKIKKEERESLMALLDR